MKQEDCGLTFPDDFKAEVGDLKLDGNCDFGGGELLLLYSLLIVMRESVSGGWRQCPTHVAGSETGDSFTSD